MVADAYLSKNTFVSPFMEAGFQVVSRLRKDANLQYLFSGEQKKGRDRKKLYDGKIDFKKLDMKNIKLVSKLENEKIYSLISNHKSLKMRDNGQN